MRSLEERVELTRRYTEQGWSAAEIARELGVSPESVVRYRKRAGVLGEPRSPILQPGDHARIHELAHGNEAWPPAELMATFGVTRQVIWRITGATTSGREYNAMVRWALKHHRELFEEMQ